MPIQEGTYAPLGYGQFSVTSTAKDFTATVAQGVNIDTAEGGSKGTGAKKCVRAEVTAEAAIRFTLDGSTPTAAIGNPLPAGAQYIVTTDPRKFQFISQAGTATVNVEFLGF